jgi:YVTN family beta-propeller protein
VRPGAFLAIILLLGMSGPEVAHYVESTLPVGAGPIALCYDSQDCKIYCASELTPTMTVIDGVTNRILRTIPIGARARALCYNPQDNKVYVACFHSYEVDVIDCSTDVCTSLYLGLYQSANAICYNSISNKVYCSTTGGSCVFVIDGVTNEILANINVGSYPQGFGYNPIDNKVYCASSNNVTVIDGVADTVIGTILFGGGSEWSDHCPIGDKMYCGSRAGTVAIIDGATDSILQTIVTGALIYDLSYNESRNVVYVDIMDTNAVKLIDAAGDSLLPVSVPAGIWPWAMCYAPETDELYCADNQGNTVAVIDGNADTLMHLVSVGRKPTALAWNPDWHRMYVANYDNATVSVIRDTLVGLEDASPEVRSNPPKATVTGGTLLLRGSNSAVLVDVCGRVAANLKPGCNRVGHVRRGIYFVRSLSSPETCKVTILR